MLLLRVIFTNVSGVETDGQSPLMGTLAAIRDDDVGDTTPAAEQVFWGSSLEVAQQSANGISNFFTLLFFFFSEKGALGSCSAVGTVCQQCSVEGRC